MRGIRKLAVLLVLMVTLIVWCSVQVGAAESGTIWYESTVTEEGVTVCVWTDADAASGVIALEYDKKALKFQDVELEQTYMAAHSINAKIPGEVKISWVAPKETGSQGVHKLMQLHFTGTSAETIRMSGSANTATGEKITVAALDLVALNAAIEAAEAKTAQDYTQESFAALETALQEAKALLSQEYRTPAQISAAAQKLEAALKNLEEPIPDVVEPPVKNGSMGIVVAIAAVCVAAAVIVVILLKKRGNKKCA